MSELDRRELLKAVAITGVAASCVRTPTPNTSSAAPVSWANSLDPEAAQKVIDSFDARLSWIDSQSLPEEVLSSRVSAKQTKQQQKETESFVRQSMKTLYAVGRFMDLPAEIKMHPQMQSRIASLQSDMDHSISGMIGVLEALTPDDHKNIKAFLKKDPEFAERVAAFIEEPAKEDGIPFQRRVGLRSNVLQFASRMASQSPSLLTDPLVKKARRIEEMTNEEHLQHLAAKMGQDKFDAQLKKMTALHQAWMMQQVPPSSQPAASQPVMPVPQPTVYTVPIVPQPEPEPAPVVAPQPVAAVPVAPPYVPPPLTTPPPNKGRQIMGKGARVMGLGTVSTGVGLLFLSLASSDLGIGIGLFFGVTLGPILLMVGLLIVLIGLIIKATAV